MTINLEDGQLIIITAVTVIIGVCYWLNSKLRCDIKHPELTIQFRARRRKKRVDTTWRSILLLLFLTTAISPKWRSVTHETGRELAGQNFSGMDLRGEDLRYTDFTYVDLSNANLSQTDLRGADLRKALNLTWGQIKEAFIDEDTQLPPSIVRKYKAEIETLIEKTEKHFKLPQK